MLEQNAPLPLKLFEKGGLLVAVLPMPGLEPQDISVSINTSGVLLVKGKSRDVEPGEKDGSIMDEWQIGPYEREVQLPFGVDGTNTNVIYGNGVLVVSMPLSEMTYASTLELDRIDSTSGIRVGHRDSGEERVVE